jgi:hypothetical protein
MEVDLRAVDAMAGVGPKHGRRGKVGQPSVDLLTDQPGRPIEPLLRRAGEKLQVGGQRTVLAYQRICLALRPRTPRGLAGLARIVALERVRHAADRHDPARQFPGLGVAQGSRRNNLYNFVVGWALARPDLPWTG